MGMMKEFHEFAVKGNVMDLAVGVIIGAAFGKIVDSLVNDLIMPVISHRAFSAEPIFVYVPRSCGANAARPPTMPRSRSRNA